MLEPALQQSAAAAAAALMATTFPGEAARRGAGALSPTANGSGAAGTQQRPPSGSLATRRALSASVSPLLSPISRSTVLVTDADLGASAMMGVGRRVSTDSDDWHLV